MDKTITSEKAFGVILEEILRLKNESTLQKIILETLLQKIYPDDYQEKLKVLKEVSVSLSQHHAQELIEALEINSNESEARLKSLLSSIDW